MLFADLPAHQITIIAYYCKGGLIDQTDAEASTSDLPSQPCALRAIPDLDWHEPDTAKPSRGPLQSKFLHGAATTLLWGRLKLSVKGGSNCRQAPKQRRGAAVRLQRLVRPWCWHMAVSHGRINTSTRSLSSGLRRSFSMPRGFAMRPSGS